MKSINLKIKTIVGLLLLCAASTSAQAQDTLMYRGGFHDGYSMLSHNNHTPTLLAAQSMYPVRRVTDIQNRMMTSLCRYSQTLHKET